MTMPIKFNTLEYARHLMDAGIPAEDAEAHANALSLAITEATVSPGELLLLKTDMQARIDMLRTEILARLEILRADVLARLEALRAEMNAKLIPLYVMAGLSLALQTLTLSRLFT